MNKIDIDTFIDRYECLYYDPDSCPDRYIWQDLKPKEGLKERYSHLIKERLNIGSLNATNFHAEEAVMAYLYSSEFNEYALAWKAGKVDWKNNQLIKSDGFEKGNNYINGYGGKIDKDDFKSYCLELKIRKKEINKNVEDENWKDAYETVMKISPKNIGPVYNINTLFFLTGGKAPIYDAFAHKAVKALLFDISPCEVYLGGNPDKHDVDKVVSMYQEYMILLKILFKDCLKNKQKDDMFIPRELDRALWVYGHSKVKYPDCVTTE